jgi:hypothetical protein
MVMHPSAEAVGATTNDPQAMAKADTASTSGVFVFIADTLRRELRSRPTRAYNEGDFTVTRLGVSPATCRK